MRSKSASEVCTSSPTPSREPTGKKSRACRVVNDTRVGTVIACEPCARASHRTVQVAAGITANVVWIVAVTQLAGHPLPDLEVGECLGLAFEAVGELVGAARRFSEEDPGDRERLLHEARDVGERFLVDFAIRARCSPTRRVRTTKSGISARRTAPAPS